MLVCVLVVARLRLLLQPALRVCLFELMGSYFHRHVLRVLPLLRREEREVRVVQLLIL